MIPMPSTSKGHGPTLDDDDALLPTPTPTSMNCFITTEAEIDAAGESAEPSSSRACNSRKGPHDAVRRPQLGPKRKSHVADTADSWLPSPSTFSCDSSDAGHTNIHHDYLQPLTPGLASLSGHESAISSLSSRRNSLTASSLHDSFPPSVADYAAYGNASPRQAPTSGPPGPQLIMPSLTVPRRRPFSVAGRSLGKIKILVTGRPGTGKTSLVQSMAQSCEHIVHIDPINPTTANGVAEVYASTKPHSWWQSASDSANMRRRSSTDEILSRNICFVETSIPPEADKSALPAVQYLESQFTPLISKSIGDADLTCILSSGAEPIVDVILYMLPYTGPTSNDIEYIEHLNTMTNVIPLIGHIDELLGDAVTEAKDQLIQLLEQSEIDCFSFTDTRYFQESNRIFAVSSAAQPDSTVMDASILMSSDYMPPLITSDLAKLVDRIFSPEGSAQLRHSAALKCVKWRQKQGIDADLRFAICRRQSLNYTVSPVLTANPFGQHPFWKRVEISNWAQDLRQSLEGEKLHRASALAMCLQESKHEASGADTRLSLVNRRDKRERRRRRSSRQLHSACQQDPLGLLQLVGQIQQSGKLSLEFLSSIGALGCLVAWICRSSSQGELVRLPGWCSAL